MVFNALSARVGNHDIAGLEALKKMVVVRCRQQET